MSDILRLSVPLTAWLVGFSAVYALQAFTCSRHWPEELAARPALVAAWLLAVAAQAGLIWLLLRAPSPSPFVRSLSLALAALALAATALTLAPVAVVSRCM
jgi:hypothetical protein